MTRKHEPTHVFFEQRRNMGMSQDKERQWQLQHDSDRDHKLFSSMLH